jgi:hypothetical protein
MARYWRYRKNGGEVDGMADASGYWDGDDPDFFGVLADPSTPDGASLVPQKIWTGSVVRNATAPEIANFATAEATDDNLIHRKKANDYISVHPTTRKALKSLVKVIIAEINVLRAQHSLADRTLAQALTAIEAEIGGGDQD